MSEKSQKARRRRHYRIRMKISGTTERPRLNVFRSLSHIYAQVIDDTAGHTLASASTVDPELAPMVAGKSKQDQATIVGKAVAERAQEAGVSRVVFDRGGYRYHGRVRKLAEAAREGGLEF
jgi:large subunit ribosomal protein L18